jgi:hypothetical protein
LLRAAQDRGCGAAERSDPVTSPERSDAKKQNDHGGSRGKNRLQEPHRGERAVERPAARD